MAERHCLVSPEKVPTIRDRNGSGVVGGTGANEPSPIETTNPCQRRRHPPTGRRVVVEQALHDGARRVQPHEMGVRVGRHVATGMLVVFRG